jgi:hypothetical protein
VTALILLTIHEAQPHIPSLPSFSSNNKDARMALQRDVQHKRSQEGIEIISTRLLPTLLPEALPRSQEQMYKQQSWPLELHQLDFMSLCSHLLLTLADNHCAICQFYHGIKGIALTSHHTSPPYWVLQISKVFRYVIVSEAQMLSFLCVWQREEGEYFTYKLPLVH